VRQTRPGGWHVLAGPAISIKTLHRADFFLGRDFRSLDELSTHFRQWLNDVANAGIHATTRRIVAERFVEERPSLQALPAGAAATSAR
jgi:hypothetical protein